VPRSDTHTRVLIQWHAIPNENKARGGWMPVYDRDGKTRGHTYGKGYDLEAALEMARVDAEEEAARYVGDWDVTVEQKPGTPGATKTKRKTAAKPKPPAPRTSPWDEVGTASDTLPWRNSYANWTTRVGEAAARHNARIAFGSDTYEAWEKGVSPDAYAKARARK
jgi:hypothetical protein